MRAFAWMLFGLTVVCAGLYAIGCWLFRDITPAAYDTWAEGMERARRIQEREDEL